MSENEINDFLVFKTIAKLDNDFNTLNKEEYIKRILSIQQLTTIEKSSEHVMIKKSNLKNAGNGVFAKKDFIAGYIICIYSPYVILDTVEGKIVSLDKVEKSSKELNDDYGDYILNLKHNISVFANPNFLKNEDCLGHMCNDRAYSPHKIYNEKFNNGIFNFLYLIATKTIKKDKEIFINYGKNYWYNNKLNQHSLN